jgi:hypothetical protein
LTEKKKKLTQLVNTGATATGKSHRGGGTTYEAEQERLEAEIKDSHKKLERIQAAVLGTSERLVKKSAAREIAAKERAKEREKKREARKKEREKKREAREKKRKGY